jgi:hypothetical protein
LIYLVKERSGAKPETSFLQTTKKLVSDLSDPKEVVELCGIARGGHPSQTSRGLPSTTTYLPLALR